MSLINWKNLAIQITRPTHDRLTARYVSRKTGSMYRVPLPARFVDDGGERITVKVAMHPEYKFRREDFPGVGDSARFATGKLSASDTLNERFDFSGTGTHEVSYAIEPGASRAGSRFELWRHWRDGQGMGILMTLLDHYSCSYRHCACARDQLVEDLYRMKWDYLHWQRHDMKLDIVAYYIACRALTNFAHDPPADFVAWEMAGQPGTWLWPKPDPDPDLLAMIRSMDPADLIIRIRSMESADHPSVSSPPRWPFPQKEMYADHCRRWRPPR